MDIQTISNDGIISNNIIEISKKNLLSNLQTLQRINPEIKISPVLKSDAYGHGIENIGPLLKGEDVPFFCVYSLEEAEELRRSGATKEILIMGGVNPEDLKKRKLDFSFAAFDKNYIALLGQYQKDASIHIYVDTGLHREGINFEDLNEALKAVKNSDLNVVGLMSHFACSNDPYCELTTKQINDFKIAKKMTLEAGFTPSWFHFGGALALINQMTDSCNVIRCGKALFGIGLKNSQGAMEKESTEVKNLLASFLPTLELRTKLIQIKEVQAGDYVGYVETFQAKENMVLGILPLGYYDGLDRRFSNKGYVKLRDVQCPIVGMISMNATIIDITKVPNPQIDMDVIVYSRDADAKNSLDNSAFIISTIPQDLLVHLQKSIRRRIVE